MISRGYRWLDEDQEHSEEDCAKVERFAQKWSKLKTDEENERFARMSRYEDGEPEGPCPCEECERCLEGDTGQCVDIRKWRACKEVDQELREAEIENIEEKLEKLGARVARPYEHWNEDERLMEYLENRYDEC